MNWIKRRIVVPLLALFMAGCGLTASERTEIVNAASEQAASVASAAAYKQVYDAMLAQGKSIEEARAEAQKASEIAGSVASAVAAKSAGAGADAVADEKRSKTSGWLASLLPAILALVGAAAKKAVG